MPEEIRIRDNIIRVPIEKIYPNEWNPNRQSELIYLTELNSIRTHGFLDPIDVREIPEGFEIVDGEHRWKAAKQLGMTEIPVNNLGEVTPSVARQLTIIRNDTRGQSEQLALGKVLQTLVKDVPLDQLKVNLPYEPEKIDELLKMVELNLDTTPLPDQVDEDEIPVGTPKKVRSRPGDIFQLGHHRLMCGDSAKKEDVSRLMGDHRAEMVFTDPPYNLAEETNLLPASVSKAYSDLADSKWDKGFQIGPVLEVLEGVTAPDCSIYICTSQYLAGKIWEWMKKWGEFPGWCVWVKPNPMPSLAKRDWTFCAELICYARRGKHVFNFPSDGHHCPNVWTILKETHNRVHPTQKPVAVPAHAIRHSSSEGQLVVDLFGGSGSTLIACEQLRRVCFTMEQLPEYVDVILDRFSALTGKDPVRQDGISWASLKE